MIISEKQIASLIYLVTTVLEKDILDDEAAKYCRNILREILDQQSEELRVVE